MRRWPLSTVAIALVLAVRLTVIPAGESAPPLRPLVVRGWIYVAESAAGDFGYNLIHATGDRPPYPLMPTSELHRRLLRENAGKRREVEVVGVLSFVDSPLGRAPYIVIEYVKELP